MLVGLHAPPLTPFTADLRPDADRFVEHCHHLLESGCHGLVPFGTTGEGTSLSVKERMVLLEALIEGGIAPEQLVPGVASCAAGQVVELCQFAVSLGCAGVLLPPPWYYTDVDEDGLYRWVSVVIDQVADARLQVLLYHIPQYTGIGLSVDFIRRLSMAYPETIMGLKDSGGDPAHTFTLLEELPDLQLFVGTEAYLGEALAAGAAGCISAMANLNAPALRELIDGWHQPEGERLQQEVVQLREAISAFPMIPALKAALAQANADKVWIRPRPPLSPLKTWAQRDLVATLIAAGFEVT